MKTDEVIQEIRTVRKEIDATYHNNYSEIMKHVKEVESMYAQRVVQSTENASSLPSTTLITQ